MSRPKLTSLADLMPPKGAATRPEPVVEHSSERASQRESEEASIARSIQGNINPALDAAGEPRAETPTKPLGLLSEPEHTRDMKWPANNASNHMSKLDRELVSKRASSGEKDDPAEFQEGPRSSVSFRMTERLKDRLREYAHQSRRQKQDVLDQAVHELLRREGY